MEVKGTPGDQVLGIDIVCVMHACKGEGKLQMLGMVKNTNELTQQKIHRSFM